LSQDIGKGKSYGVGECAAHWFRRQLEVVQRPVATSFIAKIVPA
jgi:hypothetical protein